MSVSAAEVTLYVPARDSAATLAETLRSIRGQTARPAKVVVVADTRSRDDTLAMARAAGVGVVEQREGFLGHARNLALAACETPWLASCDSDATLEPGWLAALLDALRDAPRLLAAVGGRTEERVYTAADRWRAVNMPHNWGPAAFDNPFMLVSEMLARGDALRAVGGYLPDLRYYEDSDLCQRLRHAGFTLRYQPAAVAWHERRDSLRTVLELRWSYAFQRQRHLLESFPGLAAKLDVNRTYCLQTLSQTLHSPHADVCAVSLLLWFHHAWRDLSYALSRWPFIDDAQRDALLGRALRACVDAAHPRWPAGPALELVFPAPAGLSDARAASDAPSSPESSRRFPRLIHTPGFGDYLRHLHRATSELFAELDPRLGPILDRSVAALRADPASARPAFAPPCFAVTDAERSVLAQPPRRAAWPARLASAIWRHVAPLDSSGATVRIGPALPEERAMAPGGGDVSVPDGGAAVLIPHLECLPDPLGTLREALRGACGAVVAYQPPRRLLPAVPMLQPRQIAAACAEAGLAILDFHTEAGLTRIVARRRQAPGAPGGRVQESLQRV